MWHQEGYVRLNVHIQAKFEFLHNYGFLKSVFEPCLEKCLENLSIQSPVHQDDILTYFDFGSNISHSQVDLVELLHDPLKLAFLTEIV